MLIGELTVTSNFRTDEIGLFERFIWTFQFYLCHYQSLVIALELVYLEDMSARTYQEAPLVDDPSTAQLHQMACLIHLNLFLELVSTDTVIGLSLDGKESLLITYSNPHRCSLGRNISLDDMAIRKGDAFECAAFPYQKLAFNLKSAHCTMKIE